MFRCVGGVDCGWYHANEYAAYTKYMLLDPEDLKNLKMPLGCKTLDSETFGIECWKRIVIKPLNLCVTLIVTSMLLGNTSVTSAIEHYKVTCVKGNLICSFKAKIRNQYTMCMLFWSLTSSLEFCLSLK